MSDSELRSHFQERKFYNITSGRVETIPSGAAVGQPPVCSDQGSIRLATLLARQMLQFWTDLATTQTR